MDASEIVRHCRLEAGLTQERLAIRAGTTKTAVSRLERGHLSPTVETVQRLLLCMGYELAADAVPIATRTDRSQLEAVANLSPTRRLEHGLASQSSLTGLLGAASDR